MAFGAGAWGGTRMQKQSFTVLADYQQFYLWDKGMDPLAPVDYIDEDIRNRIKTGPHVVVIQPVRDMEVPVEVQIHESEPPYDATQWDHIAECSLDLPTGQLQVHECTGGPVAELIVTPGTYRVRAFFAGLDTLDESGLEGDDWYRVVLWPAPAGGLRVLKQWSEEW